MRKQVLASLLLLLAASVLGPCYAQQTPITRSNRLLGNINFVVTGGSLRTQPDTSNSCTVGATSSQNLSGVPAGTTVIAAYLYWGGSATTSGSIINVDSSVTFRGTTVNASRTSPNHDRVEAYLLIAALLADKAARLVGTASVVDAYAARLLSEQ